MSKPSARNLSRRQRQIMAIIYHCGEATAAEVRDRMQDQPSYSTVRTLLRVLVEKRHLKHKYDGPRYVYSPTVSRETARRSALEQLVTTFFDGSVEKAMATLLDVSSSKLSPEELNHISQLIDQAKQGDDS